MAKRIARTAKPNDEKLEETLFGEAFLAEDAPMLKGIVVTLQGTKENTLRDTAHLLNDLANETGLQPIGHTTTTIPPYTRMKIIAHNMGQDPWEMTQGMRREDYLRNTDIQIEWRRDTLHQTPITEDQPTTTEDPHKTRENAASAGFTTMTPELSRSLEGHFIIDAKRKDVAAMILNALAADQSNDATVTVEETDMTDTMTTIILSYQGTTRATNAFIDATFEATTSQTFPAGVEMTLANMGAGDI